MPGTKKKIGGNWDRPPCPTPLVTRQGGGQESLSKPQVVCSLAYCCHLLPGLHIVIKTIHSSMIVLSYLFTEGNKILQNKEEGDHMHEATVEHTH